MDLQFALILVMCMLLMPLIMFSKEKFIDIPRIRFCWMSFMLVLFRELSAGNNTAGNNVLMV